MYHLAMQKLKPLQNETKAKTTYRGSAGKENLRKYNEIAKSVGDKRGRKSFAKTLEIYVKQYLNSDVSVRHFKAWAEQKPGEALPWAWKVVYGDGNGTLGPQKGQVNVLIQILTGRNTAPVLVEPDNVPRGTLDNFPSPDGQGNQLPQTVESQSIDIQDVVVTIPVPENPENR
ncbi:MAG: hypothetical protein NUW00_01080 [Candidatus Kaiserbacteria bacterium]|nr:hypothetical protein [Candidatus Kaiserbacteria bacterium]